MLGCWEVRGLRSLTIVDLEHPIFILDDTPIETKTSKQRFQDTPGRLLLSWSRHPERHPLTQMQQLGREQANNRRKNVRSRFARMFDADCPDLPWLDDENDVDDFAEEQWEPPKKDDLDANEYREMVDDAQLQAATSITHVLKHLYPEQDKPSWAAWSTILPTMLNDRIHHRLTSLIGDQLTQALAQNVDPDQLTQFKDNIQDAVNNIQRAVNQLVPVNARRISPSSTPTFVIECLDVSYYTSITYSNPNINSPVPDLENVYPFFHKNL